MKHLLLTFDIEEFDPEEYGLNIPESEKLNISLEGTQKILDLLDRTNTKATFFVTSYFAEHYPDLIKQISEKHEIALHAYKHSHNYKDMEPAKSYNFLKKAKAIIEKITKKEIIGFRAPRMQHPDYSVLNTLGIKYDSSLNPTYVPGRYNNLLKNRKPHLKNGVLIIPTSVTPLLRMPFSFVWFRYFGLVYSKLCTKLNLINSNFINIYFHPWEFVDLPYKLPGYITKNTGKRLEISLENYIFWCKNKTQPMTLGEYYNKNI